MKIIIASTMVLLATLIQAQPQIEVNPYNFNFSPTSIGEISSHTLYVNNLGPDTLIITNVVTPEGFNTSFFESVYIPHCEIWADVYQLTVSFQPTEERFYSGMLEIINNSQDDTIRVPLTGSGIPTQSIEPNISQPIQTFEIKQNYPNPFNSGCEIQFTIFQSGLTTLEIYNIFGQSCEVLLCRILPTGEYSMKIDGTSLSSGTYIYRLTSGHSSISKKMVLIK
jgi:hypothetical protein